jgi:hypothetical protein
VLSFIFLALVLDSSGVIFRFLDCFNFKGGGFIVETMASTSSIYLAFIVMTSFIASCVSQNAMDLTRVPRTHGQAVVDATVSAIREKCIFPDDYLYLRRLAYVLSNDGDDAKTYRPGFYGGIWQVSQADFVATQDPTFLATYPSKLPAAFGIDWSKVTWADLQKPLYSGIAALLNIIRHTPPPSQLPVTVAEQALVFNNSLGGVYNNYVNGVYNLDQFYSRCKAENLDIAFILDASGSLSATNFDQSKLFASEIVDSFKVGPDGVRVATLTFDSSVAKQFGFNKYTTTNDVKQAILAITQSGSGTATDLALIYAANQLFTVAGGSRPNAAKVAVIITDGVSRNTTLTAEAAKLLKAQNVEVYAFGVGQALYRPELISMASDPMCTHVKVLKDYTQLVSLLSEMARRSCEAASIQVTPSSGTYKCGVDQTIKVMPGQETTVKIQPTDGEIQVFASFDIPQPNVAKHFFQGVASASKPVLVYLKNTTAPLYITLSTQAGKPDQCLGTVQVDVLAGNHLVKVGAELWCIINKVLVRCSDRLFFEKYQWWEYPIVNGDVAYLSYPHPCKNNSIGFHSYPFSKYYFIYCTGHMSVIKVHCPTGYYYLGGAQDCIPEPFVSQQDPCTACTITNLALGLNLHRLPWDASKYVQCSNPGKCIVVTCGAHFIFDDTAQACTPDGSAVVSTTPKPTTTTTIPTTTRTSIQFSCETGPSAVDYYPYTFDPTMYIHCEPNGIAYLEHCPMGTAWDQPTLKCSSSPSSDEA